MTALETEIREVERKEKEREEAHERETRERQKAFELELYQSEFEWIKHEKFLMAIGLTPVRKIPLYISLVLTGTAVDVLCRQACLTRRHQNNISPLHSRKDMFWLAPYTRIV